MDEKTEKNIIRFALITIVLSIGYLYYDLVTFYATDKDVEKIEILIKSLQETIKILDNSTKLQAEDIDNIKNDLIPKLISNIDSLTELHKSDIDNIKNTLIPNLQKSLDSLTSLQKSDSEYIKNTLIKSLSDSLDSLTQSTNLNKSDIDNIKNGLLPKMNELITTMTSKQTSENDAIKTTLIPGLQKTIDELNEKVKNMSKIEAKTSIASAGVVSKIASDNVASANIAMLTNKQVSTPVATPECVIS